MFVVLAVAPVLQGATMLAAAAAAVTVLVARDPRLRAGAMVAALAFSALTVATLASSLPGGPAVLAGGALAAIVALVALAALLVRRPALVGLLALGVLPFRVPLTLGGDTASLLLPLYGVIGAAALAEAWRWLRRGRGPEALDVAERPVPDTLRHVQIALAAVVGLYALQAVYSSDLEVALKNVCLFYAPFAVLFRLLCDVEWSAVRLRHAFWLIAGLAVLFAAVGFYEYASGHLLLSNAKVQEANELKPYFRVNSLFFDPNIYGRFLALAMIALAATLVWSRDRRSVLIVAAALGVLWAGLVLSLSQSSFAALLAGLAVLGVLRWKALPVLGAIAVLAALAVGVVLLSPGSLEIDTRSTASLDKATSGRFDLVSGALSMARDRPVWGFGSGAFAERYRAREGVRSDPCGGGLAHDPADGRRRAGPDRPDRLRGADRGGAAAGLQRGARPRAHPRPGDRGDRGRGDRRRVLRPPAAHLRVRRVPGGPPLVDAAGRRGSPRGARPRGRPALPGRRRRLTGVPTLDRCLFAAR